VPAARRASNGIAPGASPNEMTWRTQDRSAAASATAASGRAVISIRAPQSASWPAMSATVRPPASGDGTPPAARMACEAST
jgi:hypothetical protein